MNFRSIIVRLLSLLAVVGLSLSASATTFKLLSVNLGNAWVMNGTIDTDGTVYSDNVTLSVAHNSGNFQIGIPMISPRGRPLIVTLADFTDPTYPNGIASYYYGWQVLVGQRVPLTKKPMYVVAKAQ